VRSAKGSGARCRLLADGPKADTGRTAPIRPVLISGREGSVNGLPAGVTQNPDDEIARRIVSEIEALAPSTDLSIRQIQKAIAGRASRGVVGEITKRIRVTPAPPL
jgi:hypothetical protein